MENVSKDCQILLFLSREEGIFSPYIKMQKVLPKLGVHSCDLRLSILLLKMGQTLCSLLK